MTDTRARAGSLCSAHRKYLDIWRAHGAASGIARPERDEARSAGCVVAIVTFGASLLFASRLHPYPAPPHPAGMVKLHVKRGDESQFLFETTVECPLAELVPQLVRLHNGRLKVDRLCQGQWGRAHSQRHN